MAQIQGPFELSFRECREIYESRHSHLAGRHVSIPTGLAFQAAAQEVYDAVGPVEFGKLLDAVRQLHETEDNNRTEIGG